MTEQSSSATRPSLSRTGWPDSLARLGAIRFARPSHHFAETVAFYRDLVGLPLYETFEGSYGSNGAIFGLPDASLTFEVVEADAPEPIDAHEQLCLYFPDADAQAAATRRLVAAGIASVKSHPYWEATGAVTYRDPDGREVVFAPFVYGQREPEVGGEHGTHTVPSAAQHGE